MIDKIIELFEKGYCNECNELNCLGGEPSSKVVANAIRELQQENKQLKEQLKQRNEVIAEAMRYIKKNTKYYDREYSKIYGELCDMAGAGDTRLHVVIGDEELLEILQKYKGDNNG